MRSLLLVLLLAAPAWADTPHKEGEYSGVAPGQPPAQPQPSARPSRPKKMPTKGTLSWIGFEAKDGGAQVFLQSIAPFEATQKIENGALVVHLSLTKLGSNAGRQVDTRFFDNPLSMIRAKKARRGIDVRVTFKNPKDLREASLRTATEPDGLYYAYLAFPEGTPDATVKATIDPSTTPAP